MSRYIRTSLRVAGVAAAGAGVAYVGHHYLTTTSFFLTTAHAESLPSDSRAALKKMQWKGFTELKLQSSEQVNHNVKKLTFALPDDESITGIAPISTSAAIPGFEFDNYLPACSVSSDEAYTRRSLDPGFQTVYSSQ